LEDAVVNGVEITNGAVVDVEVTSAAVAADGAVPEITVQTGDAV
jgi:hypothetical protein